MNGGEALVALLEQLHVEVVFGLCGDTSLPWYEALADAKDQVPTRPDPRRAQRLLHGRRIRPSQRTGRRVRRS